MKKLQTIKTVLAVIVLAALCACNKTDDPNNGGGNDNGNTYNGHEYVDLGLPSGTLWATCNVGTTTPEGHGDLFAWGETTPKTTYSWDNYKYGNGHQESWEDCRVTKYCSQAEWGYNGFTDNLVFLQAEDDAATANWGNGWMTPTKAQWEELLQYTIMHNSSQNNVQGLTLTGANNNSIFIPCYREGPYNQTVYYWSSTCGYHSDRSAYTLEIGGGYGNHEYEGYIEGSGRSEGLFIRPVRFK